MRKHITAMPDGKTYFETIKYKNEWVTSLNGKPIFKTKTVKEARAFINSHILDGVCSAVNIGPACLFIKKDNTP
jgi:hypothetical protein